MKKLLLGFLLALGISSTSFAALISDQFWSALSGRITMTVWYSDVNGFIDHFAVHNAGQNTIYVQLNNPDGSLVYYNTFPVGDSNVTVSGNIKWQPRKASLYTISVGDAPLP